MSGDGIQTEEKPSRLLEQVYGEIVHRLEELERFFTPECKLTFIARRPGNDEADLLVTIDDPDELVKLVQRCKARETKIPLATSHKPLATAPTVQP